MGILQIYRLVKRNIDTKTLLDEEVADCIRAEADFLDEINRFKSLPTQKQALTNNYQRYLSLQNGDQAQDDIQAETDYYKLSITELERKISLRTLSNIEEKQHHFLHTLQSLQETYQEITKKQRTNPFLLSAWDLYFRKHLIKKIADRVALVKPDVIIYDSCPEHFLNFEKFTQKVNDWEAQFHN